MSPQRLDALCLEACYPPGIPMDGRSAEHIKATVRAAVREALDAAERRCEAMQPGEWLGSDNVIRRLRDELTGEPPK